MYARNTHRVHWPTYSLFPRVMAYQNWRGSSPVGRTLAWALITVIRAPISHLTLPTLPALGWRQPSIWGSGLVKAMRKRMGPIAPKLAPSGQRGQNVGVGIGWKRREWHFIITSWYQWKPHLQGFLRKVPPHPCDKCAPLQLAYLHKICLYTQTCMQEVPKTLINPK